MNQKPFHQLIQWISGLNIFLRNKKPVKDKVVSALLYRFGLSSRKTKLFIKASHISVLDWYRRLSQTIGRIQPTYREAVAVDETKLKVNGRQVYIWVAMDVKTREILEVRVALSRSSLETYFFLSKVRKKCLNRARLITDKGPWYNSWTCRMFKHEHQTFGERNCVEQWFGLLKRRTSLFYNNINAKSIDSGIKRLEEWTKSFAMLYNCFMGLT